jgi:hypothetical protein
MRMVGPPPISGDTASTPALMHMQQGLMDEGLFYFGTIEE